MILTVPANVLIEIDTATRRRDGSRWADLYVENKKIGSFNSVSTACDAVLEFFGVDDDGMNQIQERRNNDGKHITRR